MSQILFDMIWTGMNIILILAVSVFVFWILRSIYKKRESSKNSISHR